MLFRGVVAKTKTSPSRVKFERLGWLLSAIGKRIVPLYKLTVHMGGEDETFTFPTLADRDAFIKQFKRDGYDTGPQIADDKWEDYQQRRETTLGNGSVVIDSYKEDGVSKLKFSYSEEAYQTMLAHAKEQSISVDELVQQDMQEYFPGSAPTRDTPPLSRQQRRQVERRARKKAR